jgi:hypothetical protein
MLIKCIYCLEDKKEECFKREEHVLPESFGEFYCSNFRLVLKDTVCDSCNQFFGDNLELILARDTFEGGTLRYETGIKKLNDFKSLGKRSQIIYKYLKGGFPGIYVYREYSKENGFTIHPCPQVGFLKTSGEYEWHLLKDIPVKETLKNGEYNLSDSKGCIVLSCDESEAERIFTKLGIKKGNSSTVHNDPNGKVLIEVQRELDEIIFRTVAKIGFNYLAYWQGKDFALRDSFNTIRDYIRWGKIPEIPIRGIIKGSFFPDEEKTGKKRNGHIIVIYWDEKEASLVARISLFNFIQYVIRLAKDNDQEYKQLKKGHFYNIQQMNILEIDLSKFNLAI